MAEIKLCNLTKKWNDFYGANNINLTIKDCEFLVLLGPSGCGKTTTMRMIAGLEEPSGGEVWIGDKMVNALEPKDRDVAMVFQSYGLYPHLTAYENIRFPLKMRGVPNSEHHEQVMKAARMVELEGFLERKPRALSGGQRQRVALARAMVRNPNCFLMDEPLSNLDAKLRVNMRSELKHLQHQLQVTTIFVTHDQVEAMTLADRVAVMKEGVICQVGTPEEIYNEPQDAFVAGFIGSPAMNLINGEIKGKSFVSDSGSLRTQVPPEVLKKTKNGKCILGIRAEEFKKVAQNSGDSMFAPIYSLELLGDSTLLNFKEGKEIVTAKIFGQDISNKHKMGDKISLGFNKKNLYFFAADSGKRIG